ncbi:MAG: polysaccharide deacetylase family protein [Ruminococcaceae bacterium]|nr:polysaccharide deacetylase family protein [Oscillospiraceae bacterium]
MFFIKFRTIIIYIAILSLFLTLSGLYIIAPKTQHTSSGESIEVPIIMYHSVLKDKNKSGKFVITPDDFEADLKFLKENGYTPIFMSDLINFVNNKSDLPKKPIILTFDDGYYNNYLYVLPLLKKYNMKSVISIVGIYTDLYSQNEDKSAEYAHLDWDTVNEMMNSGLIEFQNHSYNLHTMDNGRNGSKKKIGESQNEYEKMLSYDLTLLQTEFLEHTGYTPTVYTYPFGAVSKASYDIIKKLGFVSTLSCENKTNYISPGDTEALYMLNRFIRPASKSLQSILKK